MQNLKHRWQVMADATVAVFNLPAKITEADLRTYFEQVGPVSKVNLLTDPRTGESALISYGSKDHALAALKLNGQELSGRALRVERVLIPPLFWWLTFSCRHRATNHIMQPSRFLLATQLRRVRREAVHG